MILHAFSQKFFNLIFNATSAISDACRQWKVFSACTAFEENIKTTKSGSTWFKGESHQFAVKYNKYEDEVMLVVQVNIRICPILRCDTFVYHQNLLQLWFQIPFV